MFQKTTLSKKSNSSRSWHLIDASGIVLGRLSTRVAGLLRGKSKRNYTPHVDGGDFVVVTNAVKIRITGSKDIQKFHFRHSGYPGGVTSIPYGIYLKDNPEKALKESVKGMLPKSRTRKKLLSRLRVFKGPEHIHAAQIEKGGK